MNPNKCPYCGAKAVEVTVSEDVTRYFLCTGPEAHRFTWEHDDIDAEQEAPLIILAKEIERYQSQAKAVAAGKFTTRKEAKEQLWHC